MAINRNKVIGSTLGAGILIGGWYLFPRNSSWEPEFQNVFAENKAFFDKKIDPEIQEKLKNFKLVNDGAAAKKAIERIDNHTFKILTSCDVGTGWVLDYIIPKDNSYPTTWFFATNAHVIKNFHFSSNPYNQELPISLDKTTNLRKNHKEEELNQKLFDDGACTKSREIGYTGFNLAQDTTGITQKRDQNAISKTGMKEPKLFYMPINFLGKEGRQWEPKDGDYYKDFAVIEVEFETEEAARAATNNFYDTYKPGTSEGLDLSKDELMSQYGVNELALLDTNFYSLGYPDLEQRGESKFTKQHNFNESTGTASGISFGNSHQDKKFPLAFNNHGLALKGHLVANGRESQNPVGVLEWGGRKIYSFGYEYLIDNMTMGSGASGSLVTNKDGGVLGIYSNHYSNINHGVVVPLRSSGIKGIQPQYDLIRGTKGQKNSFREQIKKYYKEQNTYLSSKGWR